LTEGESHSTSWGSLVRAQYRPLPKAAANGGFLRRRRMVSEPDPQRVATKWQRLAWGRGDGRTNARPLCAPLLYTASTRGRRAELDARLRTVVTRSLRVGPRATRLARRNDSVERLVLAAAVGDGTRT